jgi:hypothetical protein
MPHASFNQQLLQSQPWLEHQSKACMSATDHTLLTATLCWVGYQAAAMHMWQVGAWALPPCSRMILFPLGGGGAYRSSCLSMQCQLLRYVTHLSKHKSQHTAHVGSSHHRAAISATTHPCCIHCPALCLLGICPCSHTQWHDARPPCWSACGARSPVNPRRQRKQWA